MPESPPQEITQLLAEWAGGDRSALNRLTPILYTELRRLAARQVRRGQAGETLRPTALVHEAYVRLAKQQNPPELHGRSHFFAIAARLMRQILVDRARRLQAPKRLARGDHVPISSLAIAVTGTSVDLVALDTAMTALEAFDKRKCRIVELRYFGGLTNAETAEEMGVSVPTVIRNLRFAESWLFRYLTEGPAPTGEDTR